MPDMQEDITIIINPSDGKPGGDYDPSLGGVVTGEPEPMGEPDDDSGVDYGIFTPRIPNPLKKLWIGKCTIKEYRTITNPVTHQSIQDLIPVLIDEPCRLSYRYEQSTNIQNGTAVVSQSITLFIRPDLTIKPGSVIEVTQHGRTTVFKGAGKPAVYTNHQELIMELADGNA